MIHTFCVNYPIKVFCLLFLYQVKKHNLSASSFVDSCEIQPITLMFPLITYIITCIKLRANEYRALL